MARYLVAYMLGTIAAWVLESAMRLLARGDGKPQDGRRMTDREELLLVMRLLARGSRNGVRPDGMVYHATSWGVRHAIDTLIAEGDLQSTDLLSGTAESNQELLRAAAKQWLNFEAQRKQPN